MVENGYTIKRSDGSVLGPYPYGVVRAFVVAGKIDPEDVLVEPGGGEIVVANVPQLAGLLSRVSKTQEPEPKAAQPSSHPRRVPIGRIALTRHGVALPPGPKPTYAGDLGKVSVVKLLYRLAVAKATGRLHVRKGREVTDIFLDGGTLRFAASNSSETLLGEILVSMATISRTDLADALEECEATDSTLGDVLLASATLSHVQLYAALKQQAETRIYQVFAWETGIYRYYKGEITGQDFPTELNFVDVARNGIWKYAPLERIQDELYPFRRHRVARLLNKYLNAQDLGLGPKEVRFHSMLDNREPLGDLVDRAREEKVLTEEAANRMLYLLWQMDLVRFAEEVVGSHTTRQIYDLEDLVEELTSATKLERLELDAGATQRQIRESYLRLAKKYHPDTLPVDSHPDLIRLTQDIFSLITEAYRVLAEG